MRNIDCHFTCYSFLPTVYVVREGNVFSHVCPSVHNPPLSKRPSGMEAPHQKDQPGRNGQEVGPAPSPFGGKDPMGRRVVVYISP